MSMTTQHHEKQPLRTNSRHLCLTQVSQKILNLHIACCKHPTPPPDLLQLGSHAQDPTQSHHVVHAQLHHENELEKQSGVSVTVESPHHSFFTSTASTNELNILKQ